MKWFAVLAGVLVVEACAPSRPAVTPANSPAATELQALLDAGVTKGLPGISAAVANGSGVVWTGTAGMADIEAGTPVRPDMLFGIGSITKSFSTVVILQLADEGRLDLHATAADILGNAVAGVPNADKATLLQLLNHTGGVPSWEDDSVWIREGRGDQLDVHHIWGKDETLKYIEGHQPLAPPGEKFSYANTNFTLLGMVIEKVTGHTAVEEIHERILDPLGLKDIRLEGFEPVPEERVPHRYHWDTPTFRKTAGINAAFHQVRPDLFDATGSNLSVEWTAGGMVATARDLAAYGEALRDGRLLSPRAMAIFTEWFPINEVVAVGHNFFRVAVPGRPVLIEHSGSVLGFTGELYWVEGTDVVVAVVSNVGTMHVGRSPASAPSVAADPQFVRLAIEVAGTQVNGEW